MIDPPVGVTGEAGCVCLWVGVCGIARDSIFPSTYKGLVRNGSSGFSTKKVEFPASLLRSEGFILPCRVFLLEKACQKASLSHTEFRKFYQKR